MKLIISLYQSSFVSFDGEIHKRYQLVVREISNSANGGNILPAKLFVSQMGKGKLLIFASHRPYEAWITTTFHPLILFSRIVALFPDSFGCSNEKTSIRLSFEFHIIFIPKGKIIFYGLILHKVKRANHYHSCIKWTERHFVTDTPSLHWWSMKASVTPLSLSPFTLYAWYSKCPKILNILFPTILA